MLTSPLRYPGGKGKLFPQLAELISFNSLFDSDYVEPYAGGAGLALKLLTSGYVRSVSLNDLDSAIYCFWLSVFEHPEELCRRVETCDLSVAEWRRQRDLYSSQDASDPVTLGFAAFYLNRTSRSGIIEGSGPIGGYDQLSRWTIDVRFNRAALSNLIRTISPLRHRVRISNLDAADFLSEIAGSSTSLIYLDPPYYAKGQRLYKNAYVAEDHQKIAAIVMNDLCGHWLVSYDDAPAIVDLYRPIEPFRFSLSYSVARKRIAEELMFVGPTLQIPPGWHTAARARREQSDAKARMTLTSQEALLKFG